MKKIFIAVCLVLCVFLLGSSPWEGAAATAPDGELPASGMFVATNSFPVNTVVDITNIETNRSTRVIVAKGLETPGLLAVVSAEAAALIGMRSGSICRIRMVQPSDPIAYLRFIEGQSAGVPAYDSGNVITEENYREEIYADDSYRPQETAQTAQTSEAPSVAHSGVTGPSYVLEPEWQNRSENIVDISTQPEYAEMVRHEEPLEEEPVRIVEEFDDYEEYEEWEEPLYLAEDEYEEYYEEEYEEPLYLAEEEEIEETEEEEYIAQTEEEEIEEPVEYVLVPTEEQPPESIYGIDPDDIIPQITVTLPEEPAPAPVDDRGFSVPRITQLENGSYYVQLAAFDSPDSVESVLNQIDTSYKPVVYSAGDSWYRVLLGPLNQGESAAVLVRFKSIGYKDAFVRHAR